MNAIPDFHSASARRRFYLTRALRHRPIGSGSDLSYLMDLPRGILFVRPEDVFGDIPVLVIGGVAVRAYAPERHTGDIDLLVEHDRFAMAAQALEKAGFQKRNELYFPNTSLGLYGAAFVRNGEEADLISSAQEWCKLAFQGRVTDQTGLRVIPLSYFVLMKVDSARGIDQGDLTRMLGRLNDEEVEDIIKVIERHSGDPAIADDVRQYAQLGRWEWESKPPQ